MIQTVRLRVSPETAAHPSLLLKQAAKTAGVPLDAIGAHTMLKSSIDARGSQIRMHVELELYTGQDLPIPPAPPFQFKGLDPDKPGVIIVGAGPAGLFAALKLLEFGIKPVLLEQGKDVRSRRRDLAILNREGIVSPTSNYCFGEGGAGTYSDGKLYTRSGKRGDINRILNLFIQFGADPAISWQSHPHIGTNKLPGIIQAMRDRILDCGGEIHFETGLTDLFLQFGRIRKIITSRGDHIDAASVILCTGHSARNIFHLLRDKGLLIEAKPFALGVRVEHPQDLINRFQYKQQSRNPFLPPASYSLVTQVNGSGVFSFCMCPGGIIAPAATSQNGLVVNGWSPSKRNNPYANSGIVAAVNQSDFKGFESQGPLAGLFYQNEVEVTAAAAGGGKLKAPAQRLTDFCNGNASSSLPDSSYIPGLTAVNLKEVLPERIFESLRSAFHVFNKKIPGFLSEQAIAVATESRTSSPVRIPRDSQHLFHPQCSNLYPCGEGAGFAGGIVSAAMDGERVATACAAEMTASSV